MSLYFSEYSPSSERKSGMPLAVDTPAPPKNTIRRDLSIISLSFSTLTPGLHSIFVVHLFCKAHYILDIDLCSVIEDRLAAHFSEYLVLV
jgi:hypothetical protein